ncbi:MAG: A24 family peptidase [archaeon]|jgi:Flp pilus assembly protein protease CpaA|nr:A24 family peptidase [Candidatus ainarchaeum sp.]MDD4467838.1 A24 family peptidase [Candidatus ainarchaeum sp.]
MITILQQIILLLGTILSGAIDAKTGYIYDWITLPMILFGIMISIFLQQWINLILGTIIFVSFFLIYNYGKIGGGDVKLFTAIALLNPTNNIYFLLTGIIVACVSSIIFYTTYYGIKYFNKGIKIEENRKGIKKSIFFGLIITIYFLIITHTGLIPFKTGLLLLLISLFGLIFIALQKGITKNFFEKKINLNKIEEDEVIAEENNSKKILLLLKGKKIISQKEALLLKKQGIKEIFVLRNLPPFGPFIAIGVIIATISPELVKFFLI